VMLHHIHVMIEDQEILEIMKKERKEKLAV
jgi:hypothetical protein